MSATPGRAQRVRSLVFEIFRFGASGLATNVAYFGALVTLLALDLRVEVAGAVAYVLSMVVNYQLQARFTFRSASLGPRAVVRYLMTHGVGLSINSGVLYLLVTRLGLHVVVGQGVALVLVVAWTYLAMKHWVFRRRLVPAARSGR